jgi:hypothetical protein
MTHDDPPEQKQSGPKRQGVPNAVSVVAAAIDGVSLEERDEEQELMRRIERLPTDVGWLLIYAGALGFILPGVVGLPMLLAGIAIVTPGGPARIARWMGHKPPRFLHARMKQIGRLLDDLDRRYPPLPRSNP